MGALRALNLFKPFFLIHLSFSLTIGTSDKSVSICPGTCIDSESFCNKILENTQCGLESTCCLDEFEMTTEKGFDFNTESAEWSSSNDQELDSETELLETDQISENENVFTTMAPTEDMFSTNAPSENSESAESDFYSTEIPVELAQCPGACIPRKHTSLCEYVIPSGTTCSSDKICCTTKTTAQTLQQAEDETNEQEVYEETQCPGACVHNSIAMYCDQILPGYFCPLNSKCCDKPVEESVSNLKCSGQCLSREMIDLCHPPYVLLQDTDCQPSAICCTQTSNLDYEENYSMETTSRLSQADSPAPEGLFSDENGQLYRVHPNGHYEPLPTITPEDSSNPIYTHIGNVNVGTGKASLYKNNLGMLFQLSVIQPFSPAFQNSPQNEREDDQNYVKTPEAGFEPEEEPKTPFSAPDDSDDMEENMKDVVLPDEGENLPEIDIDISSAERTLIKPKCPGSCLTTFLRFTCGKDSQIYDGFSCPAKTACCASLDDIEDHEQYLDTLSPFFKATPVDNEENKKACLANWSNKTTEKQIADYCWQVALLNSENQYICGGVLINEKWVLSAAHCVTGSLKENKELYIRAGVTDLTKAGDNTAGQTTRISSIFVHPKHNSMSLDNDLVILHLETAVQMNVNVCIACLPLFSSMPRNDSHCIVSGYGFLNKAGSMSLKIDNTEVSLVDDIDCIANLTEALTTVFILPGSSFCAGSNKRNSCQGDAGAPLMCYNGDRFELTGITSWSLGCGRGDVPSIYVKIANFMSWINQIITASPFLNVES